MKEHHLRVCYFGTYRANYSRNQIMIEGLRRNDIEVIECHETLWHGIEDRVQAASGGWIRPRFIFRIMCTYWRLLQNYRKIGDYDIMVLGYPGQLDVCIARLLTWSRRKPLVLDTFMSIYLIAKERGLTKKSPFTGKLIRWLEKIACIMPNRLFIDTSAYRTWFVETYNLAPNRFRIVPTGANDDIFRPIKLDRRDPGFLVIHYSTYLPGTGVDVIIEAAKLLESKPDIHFYMLGEGQFKSQAIAQAKRLGLKNVTFFGWVDKEELPLWIAKADVCLGVFAKAEQSERTVVNKVYEAMAMGKPLITGDSATVRDHITHGREALLVERDNPRALAKAILTLRDDPLLRNELAKRGYHLFVSRFSIECIGSYIKQHLVEFTSGKSQLFGEI